MALELPRFFVLQPSERYNQEYLGVINENDEFDGYVKFSSKTRFLSPVAKFEVQPATKPGNDGLVHIRSCENDKYWKRTQNISITNDRAKQHWITATADDPEEDQSDESCTLFKFISVDSTRNTVRILHVQSGCYLRISWLTGTHYVLASYNTADDQAKSDIFRITDWEPVILPKYVAFKGYNSKYLRLWKEEKFPYLQLSADTMEDPTVPCEIFVAEDNNICIKSICSENFWWLGLNGWILGDFDTGVRRVTTNNIPPDTLFRAVKVDNNNIALLNVASNNFCKPYERDCLNARVPSFDEKAWLTVEDPVMKREFYDFKYKLEDSTIIGSGQVLVASSYISNNNSEQATTLDLKLSYEDIKKSSWEWDVDFAAILNSGAKTSFDIKSLPCIFNGKLELWGKIVGQEVEWGKTKTWKADVEVAYKVAVPPMAKVKVDLFATYGKYKVPFSCTERVTLYSGPIVPTEVSSSTYTGTYTGSNYYCFNYRINEEKL